MHKDVDPMALDRLVPTNVKSRLAFHLLHLKISQIFTVLKSYGISVQKRLCSNNSLIVILPTFHDISSIFCR